MKGLKPDVSEALVNEQDCIDNVSHAMLSQVEAHVLSISCFFRLLTRATIFSPNCCSCAVSSR